MNTAVLAALALAGCAESQKGGVMLRIRFVTSALIALMRFGPAILLATGLVTLAWLVVTKPVGAADGGEPACNHSRAHVANDFNGDGNPDLLWRDKSDGKLVMWIMSGPEVLERVTLRSNPGLGWRIVQLYDFNSDCRTDILWRKTDGGRVVVWFMDGPEKLGSASVGSPSWLWNLTPEYLPWWVEF